MQEMRQVAQSSARDDDLRVWGESRAPEAGGILKLVAASGRTSGSAAGGRRLRLHVRAGGDVAHDTDGRRAVVVVPATERLHDLPC